MTTRTCPQMGVCFMALLTRFSRMRRVSSGSPVHAESPRVSTAMARRRLEDADRRHDGIRQRRQVDHGSPDRHSPRLEAADVEQAVGHALQGRRAVNRRFDGLDVLAADISAQVLEAREQDMQRRSHVVNEQLRRTTSSPSRRGRSVISASSTSARPIAKEHEDEPAERRAGAGTRRQPLERGAGGEHGGAEEAHCPPSPARRGSR